MNYEKTKFKIIFIAILFCGFFCFAKSSYAITPTISGVSGTVSTGQTLTVTGTNMEDENMTNWDTAGWNFEGSNYSADGFYPGGDNTVSCTIGYDSNVKLIGSKSVSFRQHGAFSGPSQGGCYLYQLSSVGQDFYVSGYVRWTPVAGGWPDDYMKLFLEIGGGSDNMYLQPEVYGGDTPTQFLTRDGVTSTFGNIPSGAIQPNKWYYIEAHCKNSTPKRFETWIDGTKIVDWVPTGNAVMQYMLFGMPNFSATSSSWDMIIHMDRFVVSSARIYPASIIEISNSSTYGQGTVVYQEPIYLSDSSVQIKANLTGLGSGHYYLFVTNNRQETSAAYNLSGDLDTTPPAAPGGLQVQ